MAKEPQGPPVRIVGSRELHQNLPAIMRELENQDARYVLTVHGRPKAVLVGASTFLDLVEGKQLPSEVMLGLQLSALLGVSPELGSPSGLPSSIPTGADPTPELTH